MNKNENNPKKKKIFEKILNGVWESLPWNEKKRFLNFSMI